MKYDHYTIFSDYDFTVFEFVSIGAKGNINKKVQYSETEITNVYNLAFGDKNIITGEFDDTVVSNNGDVEKVLMTVASTLYVFTDKYPDAIIYITGSSTSRTRLYQIGIARFIEQIKKDFEVYGETNEEWEPFKKGIAYHAFLIKRKQVSSIDEKQ